MAVVIRAEVPGMTKEQYDGMSVAMLQQIKATPGFIAHAGGPIPGGWQVTEIWESQEQFLAWFTGVVLPAPAANGITTPNLSILQATRAEAR